jgi:hypothetical protein
LGIGAPASACQCGPAMNMAVVTNFIASRAYSCPASIFSEVVADSIVNQIASSCGTAFAPPTDVAFSWVRLPRQILPKQSVRKMLQSTATSRPIDLLGPNPKLREDSRSHKPPIEVVPLEWQAGLGTASLLDRAPRGKT